jgi:hypothetical protein
VERKNMPKKDTRKVKKQLEGREKIYEWNRTH